MKKLYWVLLWLHASILVPSYVVHILGEEHWLVTPVIVFGLMHALVSAGLLIQNELVRRGY